ncbi:skin secretory protein xP2-like [Sorex fumeus]|uniref:skin secretory protein xP2-like n=1 Tax=Sorex fumeus TaxID=62283 RepID=UPI0024AD1498|nr:skin secretory protein xP2-like [Sorex fumeus]
MVPPPAAAAPAPQQRGPQAAAAAAAPRMGRTRGAVPGPGRGPSACFGRGREPGRTPDAAPGLAPSRPRGSESAPTTLAGLAAVPAARLGGPSARSGRARVHGGLPLSSRRGTGPDLGRRGRSGHGAADAEAEAEPPPPPPQLTCHPRPRSAGQRDSGRKSHSGSPLIGPGRAPLPPPGGGSAAADWTPALSVRPPAVAAPFSRALARARGRVSGRTHVRRGCVGTRGGGGGARGGVCPDLVPTK